MTIDATVGGATANSYLSLADAVAYFEGRLHADAWNTANDTDREAALITACRRIEACPIRFHRRPYGHPSSLSADVYEPAQPDQALKFPRQRDRDGAGVYIIPEPVKQAQCEEALALLGSGQEWNRRRQLQGQGVTSFAVEGLSETYGPAAAREQALQSLEARNLLAPYIEKTAVLANSDNPDGEWSPGSRP